MKHHNYYVYILASRSRTLYVGVTRDLERRVYQHRRQLLPAFTARYAVNRLVYFEHTNDIKAALQREKEITGSKRARKLELVESLNPAWEELAPTLEKRHPMKRARRTLAPLLTLCALASACSPAYLVRASWEEAKILARRKPIARIVADSATDPQTRRKLLVVQEARLFARDSLGLDAGDSYTLFTRVKSDTLAMVLSAAHRDRFQAH
ncbi:MAG TPA: aminopeptidase, partial [Longimicrobium sp.]|nr:aminopeptidase [Longimicrobium sp.]